MCSQCPYSLQTRIGLFPSYLRTRMDPLFLCLPTQLFVLRTALPLHPGQDGEPGCGRGSAVYRAVQEL